MRASSAILLSTCSRTNAAVPTGVPSTLTPLGLHTSSQKLDMPPGHWPPLLYIRVLAFVELDSCNWKQRCRKCIVKRSGAGWLRHDVDVCKKHKEGVAVQKLACNLLECIVDAEGEQQTHQMIPLLSAFSLYNSMLHVVRRLRVGEPKER